MDEKIKILWFGIFAEQREKSQEEFVLQKDTDTLMQKLKLEMPLLNEIPAKLALNKTLVHENAMLRAGDELAIMPPFSGG